MTYEQFIGALRPLFSEAKMLFNLEERHENAKFRKWRHQTTDLFDRIEANGYTINSSIPSRNFDNFGTYTDTPSASERMKAYNRDLQDTINEIQTVIDGYENFGDPKPRKSRETKIESLVWPEKMTLHWLWEHSDVSMWWWIGGVLVSVFFLGVSVGNSSFYEMVSTPSGSEVTSKSIAPNK